MKTGACLAALLAALVACTRGAYAEPPKTVACKEHTGPIKCLLSCLGCGYHDCKCPPFVPEDSQCRAAKNALAEAIEAGSVVATRNGKPMATEDALAYVRDMGCDEAIRKAEELTAFKRKQEQQQDAAPGPRPSPAASPPPRPRFGGPFAGWEDWAGGGPEEVTDEPSDGKQAGEGDGAKADGAPPPDDPDEEAAADAEQESLDRERERLLAEFDEFIERVGRDAEAARAAETRAGTQAAIDAGEKLAGGDTGGPLAIPSDKVGGLFEAGFDPGEITTAAAQAVGLPSPADDLEPGIADGIAAVLNVAGTVMPSLLPGVKVEDGKLKFEFGSASDQAKWAAEQGVDWGSDLAENKALGKVAGKLGLAAGVLELVGQAANPIDEERVKKGEAKWAAVRAAYDDRIQDAVLERGEYVAGVSARGESLDTPEHRDAIAGMNRTIEGLQNTVMIGDAYTKAMAQHNRTGVWIPGAWPK